MPESILHIRHSWGGGIHRWLEDFASADGGANHFFFESVSRGSFNAVGYVLRRSSDSRELKRWSLSRPALGIVAESSEYDGILREAKALLGTDRVVVSSLIGHGLGGIEGPQPTTIVLHDYFPFCRAVHLSFFPGFPCRRCDGSMVGRCGAENPLSAGFRSDTADDWLHYRQQYLDRVLSFRPTLVAPTPSLARALRVVWPEFPADKIHVVPHGIRFPPQVLSADPIEIAQGIRPRVLILGRLGALKGLNLLESVAEPLGEMADIFLLGSGSSGRRFRRRPGFRVTKSYSNVRLPEIVAPFRPHVALFLSMVPETFSYTLAEATQLGIPALATRLGAFVDWIDEGVTGYLFDAQPAELVRVLSGIFAKPERLASARRALHDTHTLTVAESVNRYRELWRGDAPWELARQASGA